VVSKLKRSFQDRKSSSREFIFGRVTTRYFVATCSQWQIFEEVSSKRVARSLSTYDRYFVITLRININIADGCVDIILSLGIGKMLIFWKLALPKK